MFAQYNSIKSNAVTSNLLSVSNDQLFDVAGRSQSPYDQRVLFAAASAVGVSKSNAVSFVFNQSLLWGNGGSVSSLAIDFGDGSGYQTVSWGTPISRTFTSTGTKRIKVRLTPTSGSVVESQFDVQVLRLDVCAGCRFDIPYSNLKSFAATSSHSGGIAFIRYSVNNTTGRIKKPLIVAEGYDVSSVAPLLQLNYSYGDFLDAINKLGGANPTSYDFNQALDNTASYDLVFIDYANGTDDIRRNAALVQDVIRWVNSQKQAGDAQNVVIGLSMGGLVGRYALAQMVRNSENTQTRLLITHDSPHRGANVPLCIQFAARTAADINFSLNVFGQTSFTFNARSAIPELDQVVNLYDAPATNQLLIMRATDGTGTTATNSFLESDYRTMVNLMTPYRILATSDGSQCGTASFAPSS